MRLGYATLYGKVDIAMRTQISIMLLSGVALTLAACGGLSGSADDKNLQEGDGSSVEQSAAAIDLSDKSALLDFEYVIPPEAAAYPTVKNWMMAEAKTLRERAENDARADEEAAKKAGFEYRTHSNGTRWSTVADTPILLAFQGMHFFDTGGAHPMSGYRSTIYDKKDAELLNGFDLFTDKEKAIAILTPEYCRTLDEKRLEKRGEATSPSDMFGGCPAMTDATIVPISTTPGKIDKMRFILDPYVAGPYVEGEYVIELPADQAMVDLIKSDYQGAFIGRGY